MSEHTRQPWIIDAINHINACVNACAGMADPAAEIAKLKGQRDRLAKASCEMMIALEWNPEPDPFGLAINREFAMRSRIDIARNKLRAALAEIEGGE